MCAGLLLQDDEGSPVQHAKGASSLPFPFFFPLKEESTVFHFQSPNICQWQNKGKTEPESGLLVLISSLRSLQGRATDEQQMRGNRFLPLVLLLSGCLSPV